MEKYISWSKYIDTQEEIKNLEELKCATIISQKKSQEDECYRQTKIFHAMDSKVQEKNGEIGKKI